MQITAELQLLRSIDWEISSYTSCGSRAGLDKILYTVKFESQHVTWRSFSVSPSTAIHTHTYQAARLGTAITGLPHPHCPQPASFALA